MADTLLFNKIKRITKELESVIPSLQAFDPGIGGTLLETTIEIIGDDLGYDIERIGQEGKWPDLRIDNSLLSLKILRDYPMLKLTSAYTLKPSVKNLKEEFISCATKVIKMLPLAEFLWVLCVEKNKVVSSLYDCSKLSRELMKLLKKGRFRFSASLFSLLGEPERYHRAGLEEGIAVLSYDASRANWRLNRTNNAALEKSLVMRTEIKFTPSKLTQKDLVRKLLFAKK